MKLSELANKIGGELQGDPDFEIGQLTSFKKAKPHDVVILFGGGYKDQLTQTQSLTLISKDPHPHFKHHIRVEDPRSTFYSLMNHFYPHTDSLDFETSSNLEQWDAMIDKSCRIGRDTIIGPDSRLFANVVIGRGCKIGKGVTIYPNVTIYNHVEIGDGSIIKAGSAIGADGFGYSFEEGQYKKVPHIGRVIIGENVEIGSLVNIDRGCLDDTIIGSGTKIDSLVQIGHNCQIGEHCVIVAQVAMLGRAHLEDYVQVGGQTGIADVVIGKGAIVASRSGVTKNIAAHQKVSGFPAWDHRKELKFQSFLRKLFLRS